MPKTQHELVVTAEVAQRLGVDVRTVHRLVSAGRLTPAAKTPGIRGAYLFTPDEVDRVERERIAA